MQDVVTYDELDFGFDLNEELARSGICFEDNGATAPPEQHAQVHPPEHHHEQVPGHHTEYNHEQVHEHHAEYNHEQVHEQHHTEYNHEQHHEQPPYTGEPVMVCAVQCTRCLLFYEPSQIQYCEGLKNYSCYSKWCTACFMAVFQTPLKPFGCGCCPSKRTKRGRKASTDIDMREIRSPTLISSVRDTPDITVPQKDDRLDRLEKMIVHLNKRLDDVIHIYQTNDPDSE